MTDQEVNEAVARKLGWKAKCQKYKTLEGQLDCQVTHYRKSKLPDYCHSIQAAWEIVDNWNESGDVYFRRETMAKKMNWEVSFWFNKECKASEWADTAPMAICLAFLKLP